VAAPHAGRAGHGWPRAVEAGSERSSVFITASGVVHDYGWSWYTGFSIDEESGEITLQTSPGDGASMTFAPRNRTDWPSLLASNGLSQVDPN
jgi:hypothetical protein